MNEPVAVAAQGGKYCRATLPEIGETDSILSPHAFPSAMVFPRDVTHHLMPPKAAKQLFLCRISTEFMPTDRNKSN